MAGLLKDRFFWCIVALGAFLGISIYAADTYILAWLPPEEEWYLSYMALERILFLVTVAMAAWRYGVRGGLAACLTIGLVALPNAMAEAVNTWRPDLILELVIIGGVGVVFSWLIGTHVKERRLLEQTAGRLERQTNELRQEVTQRQKAEEKLRELYQQEKGLRREKELEMERRVEFTRALVHELKTPLTPLLAASDFLVSKLREEPLLSFARNVNLGARNLGSRIDELLDLARGETGMLELRCELLDPLPMIKEVVDYVAPEAVQNEQSLIVALPSSLPSVWADEDRLRQVVLNLLSNAFKFTRKKGKITLKAYEKDANLIVEVKDTGCGISKEEQRWLFLPYHRMKSDRQRLGGLGLGLALSKMLVELHTGQIWVQSQKGRGSTFGFSVPVKAGGEK